MSIRVLIAVASRHGATEHIAQRVGQTLTEALGARGLCAELDICSVDDVRFLDGYDGVVVGSAIYAGRWLPSAALFVEAHRDALEKCPVWFFSGGSSGESPTGDIATVTPPELSGPLGERKHRVFTARLDRAGLGSAERAIARALGAADRDFPDWRAVDAWATEIARDLSAGPRRPASRRGTAVAVG